VFCVYAAFKNANTHIRAQWSN